MSKKTKLESHTIPYYPKRYNRQPNLAQPANDVPKPIERPAYCIGRLLANDQTDSINPMSQNLFKGQYDEKFGDIDPACDIHTDKHDLADALLRRGYSEKQVTETSEE